MKCCIKSLKALDINMLKKATMQEYKPKSNLFFIQKRTYENFINCNIDEKVIVTGEKDIETSLYLFKPEGYHIGGIFDSDNIQLQFGSFFIGMFDKEKLIAFQKQKDMLKAKEQITKWISYPSFEKIKYENENFTRNFHPRLFIIPQSELKPGKNIIFPPEYGLTHKSLNILREKIFEGLFLRLNQSHIKKSKRTFNILQQHLFKCSEFELIDHDKKVKWMKPKGELQIYALDIVNPTIENHFGFATLENQRFDWHSSSREDLCDVAKNIVESIIKEAKI